MPRSPEALSPRDIVRSGLCIGCGACTLVAEDSAMGWDGQGFRKPAVIRSERTPQQPKSRRGR